MEVLIKLARRPEVANFLDCRRRGKCYNSRGWFSESILQDPNVKAILINVFGGSSRCDRIASGRVVEAYQETIGDIRVQSSFGLQERMQKKARLSTSLAWKVFSASTLKERAA